MRLFAGMSNPLDPPQVCVCVICVWWGVCCALLINVHCKSSRCVVTVDIGVYAKWQQSWLNLFNHFHFDWHTHSRQKAKLDPAVTFPTGAKVGRQSATVNEAIEQANFLIMTFFFFKWAWNRPPSVSQHMFCDCWDKCSTECRVPTWGAFIFFPDCAWCHILRSVTHL